MPRTQSGSGAPSRTIREAQVRDRQASGIPSGGNHLGVAIGDRTRDKGSTSLCVTTTPWPPLGIPIINYLYLLSILSTL